MLQKVEFLEKADDFGDGVIIVEFEEDLKGFNDEVAFEFVGENFQAPESKYPYMILSRQKPDKTWTEIDYTFVSQSIEIGVSCAKNMRNYLRAFSPPP